MATLHGETIAVGEQVHDLVWGTGTVIETGSTGSIRVQFATRTLSFTGDGRSRTTQWPTLYWHNPLVIVPRKDITHWNKTRRICAAVATEMDAP